MKEPEDPQQRLATRLQRLAVPFGVALILLPLSTLFTGKRMTGSTMGSLSDLGPSLERLPGIQAIARRAEIMRVWQGVGREPKRPDRATVKLEEEPFLAEPLALPPSEREMLRELFCQPKGYDRATPEPRGFRADWCLEWENGKNRVRALLDLRTLEMQVTSNAGNIRCRIDPTLAKEYRAVLGEGRRLKDEG